MELARLTRILRARWLAVVVIAAVGFLAALLLTAVGNRTVDPVYETLIPIQFGPEGEQTIEDLAETIRNENAEAQIAAEPLLSAYPEATIFPDTGTARLFFLAHGETPEQSRARAEQLITAYLESSPGGGNVSEALANLEQQAAEAHAEMDALNPKLTAEEEALIAQHDLLDAQIAAIREQLVALVVADAGATSEVLAANAAQREDLEAILGALQEQESSLPERPSQELTPVESLRLSALQRRLDLLGIEYERLALRTLGVTGGGVVGTGTTTDLTPSPANPILFGTIGLVAGAVLGWMALAVLARARREIWLADDLPLPLLGAVPDRRPSTQPGPAWYDSAVGGSRKESIQALRTTLEGLLDPGFNAFAIVADQVDSSSYHAIAVDMAASFASAGRSVLLVDADFAAPADSTEYDVGEPSLGALLQSAIGPNEMMADRMNKALNDVVFIRPDLAVMPSGPNPESPADAVAGRHFRALLERSTQYFDLVLVVAGEGRTAAAQALVQRVGTSLLMVKPGKSTIPSVNSLAIDFTTQRIRQLGTVMIEQLESAVLSSGFSLSDKRSALAATYDHQVNGVDSPVGRLRFYPNPVGGGAGAPAGMSLRGLADELRARDEMLEHMGSSDPGAVDALAVDVLDALRGAPRRFAFEPVAGYLVTRVEDIMGAVAGQSNISDELIQTVLDRGFIPVTRVKGMRSVGALIESELRWELGDSHGAELVEALTEVIDTESGGYPTPLDAWLAEEFFTRHVSRTDGEPEVWHLTSETGVAQVLATGRRLDRSRLGRINTEVVRKTIDEYERSYKLAVEKGDRSQIVRLESALKELHQFEVNLGLLQVGASEDARIVYPWRRGDQQPKGWVPVWSEGIRPNIAPMQRLGLLAVPVLTDTELVSFERVG